MEYVRRKNKKSVLKFIRPSSNSIFNCHSFNVIKLITKLRLGFSHFLEKNLMHNFQNTLNLICSCGDDIETTAHYLLYCANYLDERRTLSKKLQCICDKNDFKISELLLLGVSSNNNTSNACSSAVL